METAIVEESGSKTKVRTRETTLVAIPKSVAGIFLACFQNG